MPTETTEVTNSTTKATAKPEKAITNALSTIQANIVDGGKKDAFAYVVGYVTKRLRSKIPTGPDDKKVLVNKVTYTVLSNDFRSSITVDYFNPPTTDKLDHEDVPIPDKTKLIPVCDPKTNPVLTVIPVTVTKYGWGFAADADKFAGEEF